MKKTTKKTLKKWQKTTKNDKKYPTLKKKWDKSGIKSGIFCSFFYFLSHFLKKNEKNDKKTLLGKNITWSAGVFRRCKKMHFFAISRGKISHFPKNKGAKSGIFFGVFWCFLVFFGEKWVYLSHFPTFPTFLLERCYKSSKYIDIYKKKYIKKFWAKKVGKWDICFF